MEHRARQRAALESWGQAHHYPALQITPWATLLQGKEPWGRFLESAASDMVVGALFAAQRLDTGLGPEWPITRIFEAERHPGVGVLPEERTNGHREGA